MAPPRISALSLDRGERQVTIYRDDRYFTKNPDIVLLPGGRLLCVFNETDHHWPREFSRITVLESRDSGATWGSPRIVDQAYRRRGEERWVTPRISRLRDGRLVIVCDQNDYQHCHESQPPGIYAWWSEDEGATWGPRVATGIPGIEPDRVRELEDGTLLVGSHYMFRATRKKGETVSRSSDGGATWQRLAIVASDRVHHFVEGALLPLRSGRLACIMRESNHNNYPSYLAFSDDGGSTWSEPVPAPFSGDRPFPGQLDDGRVLVTHRNQGGVPGLYAWVGNIEEEAGYRVSLSAGGEAHRVSNVAAGSEGTSQGRGAAGDPDAAGGGRQETAAGHPDTPRAHLERLAAHVTLDGGALVIANDRIGGIRYNLFPPENSYSDVSFSAVLKAAGTSGSAGAFCGRIKLARIGVDLLIAADRLSLNGGRAVDQSCAVDLTRWRELAVEYRDGKIEISVDGASVIRNLVFQETPLERSWIGSDPEHGGTLSLRSVRYRVENPSDHDHHYEWHAARHGFPNQYEIDRWLELDYNSNPSPDHGYSSWVLLPDGRLFVADYTNEDSPPGKACLKGYYLRPEELPPGR